jgi:hypothetical protein
MSNNAFPDPMNVNVVSPDPLPVTAVTNWELEVAAGRVPGFSAIHKFGRNPDIDTVSGFSDLWNDFLSVGHYTGFDATVAEIVEVFSSSAADTLAGTGARTVQLIGQGAGNVEQTEIINLNGTTPVNTNLSYLRLDRAIVLTGGSGGENVGTISGRQSVTTANAFFHIPIGANRTTICCLTIPANKVGYVRSAFATLAKKGNAGVEPRALVRFPGGVFQVVEWLAISGSGSSYIDRQFNIPLIPVPAGTDIKLQADTDTNNIGVAGGIELILEDIT